MRSGLAPSTKNGVNWGWENKKGIHVSAIGLSVGGCL